MWDWLTTANQILRAGESGPRLVTGRGRQWAAWGLFLSSGLLYGAVMGCYDGGERVRPLQACYSAVKVPLLLAVTFGISWPSFFVLNTLAGLRRDIRRVGQALLTTQAGITLVLASLSPYTALWYASSIDYNLAKLFNLAMFGLASLAGQALLRRQYDDLIERHPAHRWLMWAWLGIYAFVGIQMGWVGRPFIGAPGMDTRLFREGAWSNAYVHLAKVVWQVLGN
jgi:hypothetical protein